MTASDLLALAWAHREGIGGGIVAVLSFIADPPARVVRIRRVVLSLLLRHKPAPKITTIKGPNMSNFLEREWHRLIDAVGLSHGIPPQAVEALKEGGSALAVALKPVLDVGLQAAASEASALVVAKYPGAIGQAFGQAIQTTVSAEGAALEGAILPTAP